MTNGTSAPVDFEAGEGTEESIVGADLYDPNTNEYLGYVEEVRAGGGFRGAHERGFGRVEPGLYVVGPDGSRQRFRAGDYLTSIGGYRLEAVRVDSSGTIGPRHLLREFEIEGPGGGGGGGGTTFGEQQALAEQAANLEIKINDAAQRGDRETQLMLLRERERIDEELAKYVADRDDRRALVDQAFREKENALDRENQQRLQAASELGALRREVLQNRQRPLELLTELQPDPIRQAVGIMGGLSVGRTPGDVTRGALQETAYGGIPGANINPYTASIEQVGAALQGLGAAAAQGVPGAPPGVPAALAGAPQAGAVAAGFAGGGAIDMALDDEGKYVIRQDDLTPNTSGPTGVGILVGERGPEVLEVTDTGLRVIPLATRGAGGLAIERSPLTAGTRTPLTGKPVGSAVQPPAARAPRTAVTSMRRPALLSRPSAQASPLTTGGKGIGGPAFRPPDPGRRLRNLVGMWMADQIWGRLASVPDPNRPGSFYSGRLAADRFGWYLSRTEGGPIRITPGTQVVMPDTTGRQAFDIYNINSWPSVMQPAQPGFGDWLLTYQPRNLPTNYRDLVSGSPEGRRRPVVTGTRQLQAPLAAAASQAAGMPGRGVAGGNPWEGLQNLSERDIVALIIIDEFARRGLDWRFAAHVAAFEGGLLFNAPNGAQGEVGIFQLHPRYHLPMFYQAGYTNPNDPRQQASYVADYVARGRRWDEWYAAGRVIGVLNLSPTDGTTYNGPIYYSGEAAGTQQKPAQLGGQPSAPSPAPLAETKPLGGLTPRPVPTAPLASPSPKTALATRPLLQGAQTGQILGAQGGLELERTGLAAPSGTAALLGAPTMQRPRALAVAPRLTALPELTAARPPTALARPPTALAAPPVPALRTQTTTGPGVAGAVTNYDADRFIRDTLNGWPLISQNTDALSQASQQALSFGLNDVSDALQRLIARLATPEEAYNVLLRHARGQDEGLPAYRPEQTEFLKRALEHIYALINRTTTPYGPIPFPARLMTEAVRLGLEDYLDMATRNLPLQVAYDAIAALLRPYSLIPEPPPPEPEPEPGPGPILPPEPGPHTPQDEIAFVDDIAERWPNVTATDVIRAGQYGLFAIKDVIAAYLEGRLSQDAAYGELLELMPGIRQPGASQFSPDTIRQAINILWQHVLGQGPSPYTELGGLGSPAFEEQLLGLPRSPEQASRQLMALGYAPRLFRMTNTGQVFVVDEEGSAHAITSPGYASYAELDFLGINPGSILGVSPEEFGFFTSSIGEDWLLGQPGNLQRVLELTAASPDPYPTHQQVIRDAITGLILPLPRFIANIIRQLDPAVREVIYSVYANAEGGYPGASLTREAEFFTPSGTFDPSRGSFLG